MKKTTKGSQSHLLKKSKAKNILYGAQSPTSAISVSVTSSSICEVPYLYSPKPDSPIELDTLMTIRPQIVAQPRLSPQKPSQPTKITQEALVFKNNSIRQTYPATTSAPERADPPTHSDSESAKTNKYRNPEPNLQHDEVEPEPKPSPQSTSRSSPHSNSTPVRATVAHTPVKSPTTPSKPDSIQPINSSPSSLSEEDELGSLCSSACLDSADSIDSSAEDSPKCQNWFSPDEPYETMLSKRKRKQEEEDLFDIERIVNHQHVDGGVVFKVQWKGYSLEKCTWENGLGLENGVAMIQEYFEARGHIPPEKRSLFRLTRDPNKGCSIQYKEFSVLPPEVVECRKGEELLEDIFIGDRRLPYFGQKHPEDLLTNELAPEKIPVSEFKKYPLAYPENQSRRARSAFSASSTMEKRTTQYPVYGSIQEPPGQPSTITPEPAGEEVGCFFKGDYPLKILGHRIAQQTSFMDRFILVEFLVKWRYRADKSRPQSAWYTNAALRLICPEFLADYLLDLYTAQISTVHAAGPKPSLKSRATSHVQAQPPQETEQSAMLPAVRPRDKDKEKVQPASKQRPKPFRPENPKIGVQ